MRKSSGSPGPPGVAARLGDLVQVGPDRYMLTYAIRPGQYPNSYTAAGGSFSTQLDELALLVLDREGHILQRTKLRSGSDVEFLHTARYGGNVLLAWKSKGKAAYWMMLVDPAGRHHPGTDPARKGNILQCQRRLLHPARRRCGLVRGRLRCGAKGRRAGRLHPAAGIGAGGLNPFRAERSLFQFGRLEMSKIY